MKTSVLIIAHNEEKYIEECILSIIHQSKQADEIILIAHNCTDATVKIAQQYSQVTTIEYAGPVGVTYARIEGLSHISGDMVLCIDGDSVARNNWIHILSETLNHNSNILVGSWIKLQGTLFEEVSNIFNKYFCVTKNEKARRWIWGSSFGFFKKDILLVKKYLEESISLSQKIGLTRNPDDCWLALFMSTLGPIEVTNRTCVIPHTKETSLRAILKRNAENHRNGNLIEDYFNTSFQSHPKF